ncbi:type I restriction-modification enzyme R subunit C-terminal domain-containing protein [Acidilutibacter cellobiosedens]|uniref:type I restriction-modification enzyme R subunit C-terminal domain-containing protein n=1 Tax=Acidilutibacter cellobiosedens TaxID=2507161 RepID=UPI0019816CB5|nr:type I restriction-modification enzyme R subunit C-terminal domain-containing protein [Acidilutibacter cellobiosedens]
MNSLENGMKQDRKEAIIKELEERGVFFEELKDEVGKDLDPFDLICHIAFDMPPLTRRERANNVMKKNYFTKYGESAREVLVICQDLVQIKMRKISSY